MKLIVGLGNFEDKYTGTRHNVGYDFIEELIKEYDAVNLKNKFHSEYQIVNVGGEKIIFQKPTTYMNLSGIAISEVVKFYKLNPKTDVIVIYDDMDISLGKFKIRKNGSSAGHNGIKSTISLIGDEFLRIKIGIDKPKEDRISFVLGHFNKEEQEKIREVYNTIKKVIGDITKLNADELMNKYNRK